MDKEEKIVDRSILKIETEHFKDSFKNMVRWFIPSILIGLVSGVIGVCFDISVEKATELRAAYGWLIFLLPVCGIVIAAIYRYTKMDGVGTGSILFAIRNRDNIPLILLPVIFISTVFTHLFGGSAGREGAALQMGGCVGNKVGRVFRMKGEELSLATMCGSSAFFSALFGTPLTAAVFVQEVSHAGLMYHYELLPCLVSSLAAYGIAHLLNIKPAAFAVSAQPFSYLKLLSVAVLALAIAIISRVFVELMHVSEKTAEKAMKNVYLRGAAGGVLIIAMTYAVGSRTYNGAGMDIIAQAIEQGKVPMFAFFFKMIFTAVTISCGFRGGEIVPSFFIGASLGCVLGPVLGLPAGFAASLGLIAMFCGCTNSPLASIILGIEIYGGTNVIYIGLICCMVYLFSGTRDLFGGHRVYFSRYKKG